MITTDPTSQVSPDSKQAVPNANGTYTFVISLEDPGVYNWLSTTGLFEGTIMVHWQSLPTSSSSSASSTGSPAIEAQVVPLSELRSVLPSQTRYVTAEERTSFLIERAEAYAQTIGRAMGNEGQKDLLRPSLLPFVSALYSVEHDSSE